MFKKTYIQTLARSIALALVPRTPLSRPQDYSADPLSHPDLSGMSLQQLADLPFEPRHIAMPIVLPKRRNAGKAVQKPAIPASACIAAASPL